MSKLRPVSDNFYLAGCYLEIISECNIRCIHCYNESGSSKNMIDKETFIHVVNSLPNNKDINFTISGGEPLTHPNLWEFVDILKNKDFGKVLLITNATLITKEIAKKFSQYNIGIQVSLNGSSSEVHDKLCGKGNFNRTISGLNYLIDEGLNDNIVVRCVLNKFNKSDIVDFIKFLSQKKIKGIDIAELTALGRSKSHMDDIGISPEEKSELVDEWLNNAEINRIQESGMTINFPEEFTGSCPLLMNLKEGDNKLPLTPRVDAGGQVYLCQVFTDSEYSIGNIYKKSLVDILYDSKLSKNIEFFRLGQNYMHECKKCLWNSICGKGCVALAVANGSIQDTDGFCSLRRKHFISTLNKSGEISLVTNVNAK